jgi:catechol 2,3-dioxygenase-like lactoylglutathione lyase family enzyme
LVAVDDERSTDVTLPKTSSGTKRNSRKRSLPTSYLGAGIALQVPDVADAVRYYQNGFGLELAEMDDQNRYAALRSGKLGLDLVDEHGAGTRATGRPGDGVAMYVSVDDVDEQLKWMKKSGVPILTRVDRKRAGVEEFSVRDEYGLLWIFTQSESDDD